MAYALYRKYRPSSFDDIQGQERIVRILKRGLETGDVSHAYLFSGGRGLGKTSLARIFAHEIGCDSVDIFEMDAASHTSVEDIRALNEAVHTLPLRSSKKVYILDEAHMLSKAAFNAFLKTLEEPPHHIVFILVTTENINIPDTIKSRCQICLFEKPSFSTLSDVVLSVAKKEKRAISKDAAHLISLISDGSFRDALTLLQNILVTSEEKNVPDGVVEHILGASPNSHVVDFVSALLDRDVDTGVRILEEISQKGYSASLFGKRIVFCVREALFSKFSKKKSVSKDISHIVSHDRLSLDFFRDILNAVVQPAYVPYLPLEMLLFSQVEKK